MMDPHDDEYELPPDDQPRFVYEEAEACFDAYAAQQGPAFRRAWMKTKFMATAYAYGDFWDGVMHPATAISRGWEELQLAFTGRGEAFLSGAVLELWCQLPDSEEEEVFADVIREAWAAAERATPGKARRLYARRHRLAKARNPDDGFTLEPVLPNQGVRLREWALGESLDADHVEEQLGWLEAADRQVEAEPAVDHVMKLRVIEGGQGSQ